MTKNEYVKALIEYTDFINQSSLPDEWEGTYGKQSWAIPSFSIFTSDKKDFGKFCSGLGRFNKGTDGTYLEANKRFQSGIILQVNVRKELTCEKVKVGTKTIPAQEARLVPAEPEREEDVYEWKCPESFVALKEEANVNA